MPRYQRLGLHMKEVRGFFYIFKAPCHSPSHLL
nr:MAG TPA: hypothetical protein [Caudoviricetes sp.]